MDSLIGTIVLVRDDRAGVRVGTLTAFDFAGGARVATLTNARWVWCWQGAAGVHGIAARGLSHSGSKVCPPVASVTMTAVIEIVSCSEQGSASVAGAPEWTP